MKRFLLIILFVFVILQAVQVEKTNEKVERDLEIKASSEVMDIFKRACYDCHSNETKWPWYSYVAPASWTIKAHVDDGKKALNFSIWETYTKEQKDKHMKNIFRTVYAAMPLELYIKLHGEADLTKDERKLVREWTGVRR